MGMLPNVEAQIFPQKIYPQRFFVWPVEAKVGLAANFGELRANHFHMGLDCKTDQKENTPILAAGDGYIAKVKIEPYGFGRAIYINHPNELTTLYAHLNDFYPELEAYVTQKQYTQKRWDIFIDIPPALFPVEAGQFIAYSGNTGGSQGPHLHFEVRDTKTDKVLNPLLMNFGIEDNVPPDIIRLAVYDRNLSVYEQTPKFIPIKKVNGVYQPVGKIAPFNTDKVSFAITAYDRYTGSTNQNGIYEAIVYDNDEAVAGFQLDSISYDETRYLNAQIDFKLRSSGGPFVQHLSRMPGFLPGVYTDFKGDGVIELNDTTVHHISITTSDPNQNRSTLNFDIQRAWNYVPPINKPNAQKQAAMFHPGCINIFENSTVQFYLAENQIYDSLRVKYTSFTDGKGRFTHQLLGGIVPLHTFFSIRIKNTTSANPTKLVVKRFWNGKDDYKKAEPVHAKEPGWYQASFKALGNFQLFEDVTPPTITPIGFKEGMNAAKLNRLAFVIKDDSEDIYNFTATLDGQWLRFSNDKGKTFIYKFDEHCLPGEHELILVAEDCVGNRTEKIYHFTR